MNESQVIYQRPCPELWIYDKNANLKSSDKTPKLKFSLNDTNVLQSYSFSLNTSSVEGSFQLTFYPETESGAVGTSLFDRIDKLDLIEIYEKKIGNINDFPAFVGIVKKKRYKASMSGNGITRRLFVTGIAVVGLTSQFSLSLDTNTCAITNEAAANESLSKGLTVQLADDRDLSSIISKVFSYFIEVANKTGMGNVGIMKILENCIGEIQDIISVQGDVSIGYDLGQIFDGETTQNFFSILENIIPKPVYEKFAVNDNGIMRIRVRQVPFSKEDWISNKVRSHDIDIRTLKDIDLQETDDEVYTVFYSYLSGSALSEDKLIKLFAQGGLDSNTTDGTISSNPEKFAMYGYRLLTCHFRGYVKPDGKADSSSGSMKDLNDAMRDWYSRLDDMLSGTILLSMTYDDNYDNYINPGDKIRLLGGEFYVEGIAHSWSYGGNGTISLSVSRGGRYDSQGNFSILKNVSQKVKLLEGGRSAD